MRSHGFCNSNLCWSIRSTDLELEHCQRCAGSPRGSGRPKLLQRACTSVDLCRKSYAAPFEAPGCPAAAMLGRRRKIRSCHPGELQKDAAASSAANVQAGPHLHRAIVLGIRLRTPKDKHHWHPSATMAGDSIAIKATRSHQENTCLPSDRRMPTVSNATRRRS